jgi:two-component system nitrogen regulation sensor histidine kinase GlnL
LLERELDAPHLIEYTQVIIGESDRLQSLVNRLLTPHRLPSFRLINVHEVLLRVKGVVQAEFPHIPVALDFDISLPEFDADPEQLMQSALNIVRNAAQALSGTTADPRVGVSTRVARNLMLGRKFHRLAVAVAVEDNGPGRRRVGAREDVLPARLGARGRQRPRAHDRADLRRAARRHDRVGKPPGRTVFTIFLPLDPPRAQA